MAEPLDPKRFTKEGSSSSAKAPKLKYINKTTSKKSSPSRVEAIPKQVANRMVRRIAFTSGLPTLSGMGVFVGSYFIVTRGIAEIAPVVTLVSSAACFLLGLAGLSYGILSSSWDTEPGSFLGLENIRPNIGRVRSAFKTKD